MSFGGSAARGKFISSAKVLTAMPSISQARRVYRKHGNEDRFKSGGEAVVSKD